MRKKYFVLIMLFIIYIFSFGSYASTLSLNIISSRESIKVGQEFEITVDWQQGMQAADFILEYDSEKIRFVESDVGENYINEKNNQLLVVWFSNSNEDRSNVKFKFEALSEGNVEFTAKSVGGFATGNLEVPDNYEEGQLQIEIKKSNLLIKILFVIGIFILFMKLIKAKKQRRKRK